MNLTETVSYLTKYAKTESPALIFLVGELGAGKTHLTNEFAKEIGIGQRLPSPTFTFLQEYRCNFENKRSVLHADFYRIEPNEAEKTLEQIGFWDYLEPTTILFIEWPEKAASQINEIPHTTVTITLLENGERHYAIS
jgi:tRNA threonylcarbamoyl adenosine modification protein YjeE